MPVFTKENFHSLCDEVAARDADLQKILTTSGYPPLWIRPNTFETLVLTILEQQVSLASAYAAYKRLKEKLPVIVPQAILSMPDEELRSCYFSRQKIVYVRELAQALLSGRLDLATFETEEDEEVRSSLTAIKGIGNWTADIYLLHALQRTDVFPIGDVALVNAVRMIKGKNLDKDEILLLAEQWRPYRSIATMIFWQHYINVKNLKVLH